MRPSQIEVDQYLMQRYKYLNKRYFSGRLPDDVLIGWDKSGEVKRDGSSVETIFTKRPKIAFDPYVKPLHNYVEFSLLHEMVHLFVTHYCPERRNHGRNFQRHMLILAAAGAFEKLW